MDKTIEKVATGEFTIKQAIIFIALYLIMRFVEWIAKRIWDSIKESEKPNSHDAEVWKKINSLLDEETVSFWRQHDLGDSFHSNRINPIFSFTFKFRYDKPDIRFLDKKLEVLKEELVAKIKDFSYSLAVESGESLYLKNRFIVFEGDLFSSEERLIVDELNKKADEFVEAYDNLYTAVIKKHLNQKLG